MISLIGLMFLPSVWKSGSHDHLVISVFRHKTMMCEPMARPYFDHRLIILYHKRTVYIMSKQYIIYMVASYIVSVKTIYPQKQSLPYSLPALISHLPIANPFHRRAPFHLTVMIAKSHVAVLVKTSFHLFSTPESRHITPRASAYRYTHTLSPFLVLKF